MKELAREAGQEERSEMRRKKTLLERLDIPVDHLDFRYIETCNDFKEIEKIIKILRSGEEGHFPDLEKFAVNRLETLNPKSRLLRVEIPMIRSEQMNTKELDELKRTFLDWVDKVESENQLDSEDSHSTDIFNDIPPVDKVPIRTVKQKNSDSSTKDNSSFIRPPNPERIKSWEYHKWDKFDVDAELTKLDVESMQIDEWDKSVDKAKLKEEQELVAKLMKNEDVSDRKIRSVFSTTSSGKTSGGVAKNQVPEAAKICPPEDLPDLDDVGTDTGVRSTVPQPTPKSRDDAPRSSTIAAVPERAPVKERSITSSNIFANPAGSANRSSLSAEGITCRDKPQRPLIEELPDDCNKRAPKPKSRFRIQIDDLHID